MRPLQGTFRNPRGLSSPLSPSRHHQHDPSAFPLEEESAYSRSRNSFLMSGARREPGGIGHNIHLLVYWLAKLLGFYLTYYIQIRKFTSVVLPCHRFESLPMYYQRWRNGRRSKKRKQKESLTQKSSYVLGKARIAQHGDFQGLFVSPLTGRPTISRLLHFCISSLPSLERWLYSGSPPTLVRLPASDTLSYAGINASSATLIGDAPEWSLVTPTVTLVFRRLDC